MSSRGGWLPVTTSTMPPWFAWFRHVGELMSDVPIARPGEMAVRLLVSAPTDAHVPWAVVAGAAAAERHSSSEVLDGDRVTAWVSQKMQDCIVTRNGKRFFLGGMTVPDTWPVARVPLDTPEGRSIQQIPHQVRDEIRSLDNVSSAAWHMWYGARCAFPVALIGRTSKLLRQLGELTVPEGQWLSEAERVLLKPFSLQITNPHRFCFFPYSVLTPGLAGKRPWLRNMESRLVVIQDFSNQLRLDRYFQMGVPRVIVSGRRSESATKAHIHGRDLLDSALCFEIPQLAPPPPGVHVIAYKELVQEDPGHIVDSEDEEEFEL